MVYPGKKNAHHKLIAFLKIIKVKFWLSSMYYINCYHVGKIVFLFFFVFMLFKILVGNGSNEVWSACSSQQSS